ncbi:hydrogenase maturation protease [Mycolicibacterium chubuense NBB4]|uniref:Hydrogenase maturation protease n=1 Tax=Mycolicibacterium chubuense (strain NBB4) TaxID=710421 RepID=I4BGT2_MYCCN|nr:hydrogenase maturation protease [Mycolicibacterium chubuense]AFM16489.1 hydrogenase maturation protease [Mycolicibacterium chubuense NBB4]
MTGVVIGLGNVWRRDDGVGPAVIAELLSAPPPGVRIRTAAGEPDELLETWTGAALAVVVDAASGPEPGRVRRWVSEALPSEVVLSSHGIGLTCAVSLGACLGRLPDRLVVVTVDGEDFGYGQEMSPAVGAAVCRAADAVRYELLASAFTAGS